MAPREGLPKKESAQPSRSSAHFTMLKCVSDLRIGSSACLVLLR
jgi:hypothetical protein